MRSYAGLLFGMTCAIGFALALAATFFLSQGGVPFFPALPAMSLGVLLTFGVVVVAARRRGLLEASVVAVALVVFFDLAATCALDLPLERGAYYRARQSYFPHVAGGGIIALALAASAAGLVASWVTRARALAFTRIGFRVLAGGAFVASTTVVVFSMVKTRVAIDPDALRARVEAPMCLPALATDRLDEHEANWSYVRRSTSAAVTDDEVRVTYRARFDQNTCEIRVEPPGDHGPRGTIAMPSVTDTSHVEGKPFAECPAVCVARARDAQLWLISSKAPYEMTPFALVGPPFSTHGDDVESFARDLAPPLAWIALALSGIAIASTFVFVAWRRRDRRLEAARDWIEVTMDGWPMLRSPEWKEGLYRGAPIPLTAGLLVPGTRADLQRRLAHSEAGIWAFAFAVIVVSAAPLAAAARYGLVF